MHYALCINATEVKSPNGNLVLNFTLEQGRPTYTLSYKGKEVVRPSHLGLELAKDKHASMGLNENDLMDGFSVAKEETSTFDETWKPIWGESATIQNHYNELAVTLAKEFNIPKFRRRNCARYASGTSSAPYHHPLSRL